jgi:hypothetical protein
MTKHKKGNLYKAMNNVDRFDGLFVAGTENLSLDHLPDELAQKFVDGGVYELMPQEAKTKEKRHGTND